MKALGIRGDDVLLAAWNAAGVPIVAASALAPILTLGDAPDTLAGAVQLVAVAGAIVAIATRPAGVPAAVAPFGTDARLSFIGPLVGAVAFVAGSASAYLGASIDGLVMASPSSSSLRRWPSATSCRSSTWACGAP